MVNITTKKSEPPYVSFIFTEVIPLECASKPVDPEYVTVYFRSGGYQLFLPPSVADFSIVNEGIPHNKMCSRNVNTDISNSVKCITVLPLLWFLSCDFPRLVPQV